MSYTLAQLAKGIVSGVATVTTIVTAALAIPGIIPLSDLPYITAGISILGTIGVVVKRMEPTDPPTAGKHTASNDSSNSSGNQALDIENLVNTYLQKLTGQQVLATASQPPVAVHVYQPTATTVTAASVPSLPSVDEQHHEAGMGSSAPMPPKAAPDATPSPTPSFTDALPTLAGSTAASATVAHDPAQITVS